ncbi:hypothetical protein QUA40_08075 [Microcoleus sp. Pol11C3]|uniref:hypothetical protein n=1 Tax=Microcoleus sp. Pol11C3 TaxID=3055390 RepID=UPI002FD516A8
MDRAVEQVAAIASAVIVAASGANSGTFDRTLVNRIISCRQQRKVSLRLNSPDNSA